MVARGSPFGGLSPFVILLLVIVALSLLSGGGTGIARYLQDPYLFIGLVVGFGIAVTFHEFMHAYVANRLGDATGRVMGRMSLNPLVHLDPVGTLFLVLAGFGWGKPVPVNYARLRGARQGGMAVAFAGPATNFVVAAVFAIPFHLGVSRSLGVEYERLLIQVLFWNALLGVFNLIPIPPLDGSKVLYGVVPPRWAWYWPQFELFGPFLLILLIFAYPAFGTLLLRATVFVMTILGVPFVFR